MSSQPRDVQSSAPSNQPLAQCVATAAYRRPALWRKSPGIAAFMAGVAITSVLFLGVHTSVAADPAPDASTPAATQPAAATSATPDTVTAPPATSPVEQAATPAAPTALDRLAAETANEKLAVTQRQFRARQLVDQARQADAAGDKAAALQAYSQAADLDPSNQIAQSGKSQLLAETGKAAPTPAAGQFRSQIEVELQDIRFRFDNAVRDSKAAIATDDFTTAQRRLQDARVARSIDPGIFPPDQLREMDATIAQTFQQLNDEKLAYDQRTAQSAQKEIETISKQRADEQRLQRDRSVANLIQQSRQDIDAGNYAAAIGVLDQIQVLDPKNVYAVNVRESVEDQAIIQEERKYREQYDLQFSKQLNAGEEKKIPYDDIIRYPNNWPDISELRDEENQAERGLTREDQATQALLDKVLPETNFEGQTLADAIGFLSDATGANIVVDTRTLDAAGVDRTTPINLRFRNVKVSKALSEILTIVGGQTKLGYNIDQGVITVSTVDKLNTSETPPTEVYDIRDLLVTIPNYTIQDISGIANQSSSGGGVTIGGTSTGGGGIGNSLAQSGGGGSSSVSGNQGTTQTQKQLMDNVVSLVTTTVDPTSWKTTGGTIGAISELEGTGQIVVTQTQATQRAVADLLDKLREERAIMVTVETRFLTVNRDFIETVGLNLDAVFNLNQNPGSVFSTVPVHVLDSNFTNGIQTGAPGSIGASATPSSLAFTYLDDFQVNFMITAVEASTNNTLVNAPRVTVYDGGTAVLFVGSVFDYVADLIPTVSSGAVAYSADIETAQSGVQLQVKATVSADRKYVTLAIQPTLTAPPVFTPFSIAVTTAPTTGGLGSVVNSSVTATLQLISQQRTALETLVTVPDGGTLLMGGQTIAAEAQAEKGVPVLSQIPFLRRLFTNEASAKDEQVVLIMVKPIILLQREQEDKAFPLLSNRSTGG